MTKLDGGPPSPLRTPKTIFERSKPGRRAWSLPDVDGGDFDLAASFRRSTPPKLPEVDEPTLVRHYTQLSERNFAIDNAFYPLGWSERRGVINGPTMYSMNFTKGAQKLDITVMLFGGKAKVSGRGSGLQVPADPNRETERLEAEDQLDRFLYLAASHNLLSFLGHSFASVRPGLYLGLAADFLALALDTPVVEMSHRRPHAPSERALTFLRSFYPYFIFCRCPR